MSQGQGATSSAMSSPIRICGSSSRNVTPESYERIRRRRQSMGAEEVPSDDSTLLDLEETGTKPSGDDEEASQLSIPDYSVSNDSVSSIVLRAKKLGINDQATKDMENPVGPLRFKCIDHSGAVTRAVAPLEAFVSVNPSLNGLPEEMLLGIVFYLDVFDILRLRSTNRRLSDITRARVIWILHLSSLLEQIKLPKNTATFLDSRLSTSALENIVKRPHSFAQKWFYGRNHHHNPSSSQALSMAWKSDDAFRLPTLLPGGRWLIAVCGNRQPMNNTICLWDLEHARMKGLPEAQMEAAGMVVFVSIKMDRTGSFAFMAVLTCKLNVALFQVYRLDVYQIRFFADSFGFFHIDSMSLNERRAHEVQIYPEHGQVLIDLYDRVLIWAYSPEKKCAWMVTSRQRHRFQRFTHRAAHAIARTNDLLLVADGDESTLRAFNFPPLLNRPTQLSSLALYIIEPTFRQALPSFSVSLRFSDNRLVDISSLLEVQASRIKRLAHNSETIPTGSTPNPTSVSANDTVDDVLPSPDPTERGVLFIDATGSGSYLFCSYPFQDLSLHRNSPKALIWTSVSREDVFQQIQQADPRHGYMAQMDRDSSMSKPFNIPSHTPPTPAFGLSCTLWVGDADKINPSLLPNDADPKAGRRTVVLMRSPDHPGGLVIISAPRPPEIDSSTFTLGQAFMTEVEQGEARTVLGRDGGTIKGKDGNPNMQIEEASVDPISGRMCIVETTPPGPFCAYACMLRLLEYA